MHESGSLVRVARSTVDIADAQTPDNAKGLGQGHQLLKQMAMPVFSNPVHAVSGTLSCSQAAVDSCSEGGVPAHLFCTWGFHLCIVKWGVGSQEEGVGRCRLMVLEKQIHASPVVQPEGRKERDPAQRAAT